ncbi:proline dehydrogenase family protein [Bdellovibrionota bacterium FG-1]
MLNQLIAKTLPMVPKAIVYKVARRYVAGNTLDDAMRVVTVLNGKGIQATVDFLGEFVSDRAMAEQATHMASQTLEAISGKNLGSGISLKLTSLGLDIDDEFCFSNLRGLVEQAGRCQRFVRMDMENTPYTTRTLNLYRRLRAEGLNNTGVVIQAYLRRSEADIQSLASLNASVRLCKGIYREAPELSFQKPDEIRENYKRLLQLLFENGMHVAIATHDDPLIDFAQNYIAKHAVSKDRYEFQMLLGVRDSKRDELVSAGHKMRVYVPYGNDWYGYSLRRLRENPEIAGHILKAIVKGD